MSEQELLTLKEIRKSINDSIEKYDFSKEESMKKYIEECDRVVKETLGPDFYVDEVTIDRDHKIIDMEICQKIEVVTIEIQPIKEG